MPSTARRRPLVEAEEALPWGRKKPGMASGKKPTQRNHYYGVIPLSAGEQEYLKKEEESKRRKARLVQVREQERQFARKLRQRYQGRLEETRQESISTAKVR